MKTSEIVELTTDEIIEKIEVEEDNLRKTRLNHSVSELENPMLIRMKRKDIARLKTELRKRQLEEQKGK